MTAPAPKKPGNRTWLAVALASFAVVIAVVALVVALVRSTTTSGSIAPMPTYDDSETAVARERLCEKYGLASRVVRLETNTGGTALARISLVNGAAMLEAAVAAPSLAPDDRAAAQALADAYRHNSALASLPDVSDSQWDSSVDDVRAKDAAMAQVCDGD